MLWLAPSDTLLRIRHCVVLPAYVRLSVAPRVHVWLWFTHSLSFWTAFSEGRWEVVYSGQMGIFYPDLSVHFTAVFHLPGEWVRLEHIHSQSDTQVSALPRGMFSLRLVYCMPKNVYHAHVVIRGFPPLATHRAHRARFMQTGPSLVNPFALPIQPSSPARCPSYFLFGSTVRWCMAVQIYLYVGSTPSGDTKSSPSRAHFFSTSFALRTPPYA